MELDKIREMALTATREEKRNEIIQAAIVVFSEYGFDEAKMEHIAKEAGIGKGTIYEYFESKEALFQEMLKYSVEAYQAGLKQAIAKEAALEKKLYHCSAFNARFLRDHLDIFNIALQVNILPKDMREYLFRERGAILDVIGTMIREGMSRGEVRSDLDAGLAALSIVGTIDQFSMQKVFVDQSPLDKIDHGQVVELMLRGISNEN